MADNFKVDNGRYTVEANKETKHGYFEHKRIGEGGGLWFEASGDGLSLIDYDGVFELPDEVIDMLRDGGFIVGKEFE